MVASMLVGGIFTLICALFEEGGLRTGMAIMGERVTKIQGDSSARRLGFVDLDFECSTVCPTLLGLMGTWQKRLAAGQDGGTQKSKSIQPRSESR